MLYQLGAFGYDEGEIDPSIILEHEKVFSEDEIIKMLKEVDKSTPENPVLSREDFALKLCNNYGFKLKEAKVMNLFYIYGL